MSQASEKRDNGYAHLFEQEDPKMAVGTENKKTPQTR
jgi:hypothetical protein